MGTHAVKEAPLTQTTPAGANLTVTNAVWVATAVLHKKYGERDGFAPEEIVRVVRELNLTEGAEDSIWQHVRQHSVANKKPQPNTVCMLFDPGGGVRRLFRSGDKVYPGRNESRTHPKWEDLPTEYQGLRRWYEEQWEASGRGDAEDPLLALVGSGKHIWKNEHADEFIARLRSDWGDDR
jgi:hypothetical protein